MHTKTLAALTAAALLAACQRPDIWNKPGVDQAQFHRDNLECNVTARAVVGDSFAFGPPLYVALAGAVHQDNLRGAYRECMMGKDYARQTQ